MVIKEYLGYLQRVFDWVDENLMSFPQEEEPQPSFSNALLEVDAFDKFAKSKSCPRCHANGKFTVEKFERGNKGWNIIVRCGCGLIVNINATGFNFERVT